MARNSVHTGTTVWPSTGFKVGMCCQCLSFSPVGRFFPVSFMFSFAVAPGEESESSWKWSREEEAPQLLLGKQLHFCSDSVSISFIAFYHNLRLYPHLHAYMQACRQTAETQTRAHTQLHVHTHTSVPTRSKPSLKRLQWDVVRLRGLKVMELHQQWERGESCSQGNTARSFPSPDTLNLPLWINTTNSLSTYFLL